MVAILVSVYHLSPDQAWRATPVDYAATVTIHERLSRQGDARYDQDRAEGLFEHLRDMGIEV